MYTKDKNQRITLRLNAAQFQFVQTQSDILGVSPSDFLRMMVNASMSVTKKVQHEEQEGNCRENEVTDIDDLV